MCSGFTAFFRVSLLQKFLCSALGERGSFCAASCLQQVFSSHCMLKKTLGTFIVVFLGSLYLFGVFLINIEP